MVLGKFLKVRCAKPLPTPCLKACFIPPVATFAAPPRPPVISISVINCEECAAPLPRLFQELAPPFSVRKSSNACSISATSMKNLSCSVRGSPLYALCKACSLAASPPKEARPKDMKSRQSAASTKPLLKSSFLTDVYKSSRYSTGDSHVPLAPNCIPAAPA